MIYNIFLLLTHLHNAHATPVTRLDTFSNDKQNKKCDITISFGSKAMGIDSDTHKKIIDFIEKSKTITGAFTWAWGREGEQTVCVYARAKDIKAVAAEIKELVPEDQSKYVTTIEVQDVPVKSKKKK